MHNDIRKAGADREHLEALLSLHAQPVSYSVSQREALQLAVVEYDKALMRTRSDSEKFLAINALAADANSEITSDEVLKAHAAWDVY